MLRSICAVVAACAAVLVPAATASANSPSSQPTLTEQTLYLDTYEAANDGAAGPVTTTDPLIPGRYYVVAVDGTFAVFNKWTAPFQACGTPEPSPMYPSPNAPTNGPVGVDAEVVFARPSNVNTGNCSSPAVPYHNDRFRMDLGSGVFGHIEPLGGPYTTPTANHTYWYLVRAVGDEMAFRFQFNDNPTADNYGQLRIRVFGLNFTPGCKNGGWMSFGVFKNQGDCVSYFATDGRNPPSGG